MKKVLLIPILAFQLNFAFGQDTQWGSWNPVSCYSSLSTSVMGNGYVVSISEYSWQVRIKSSYSKTVTFNMTWIVGGERLSIGQVTLNPGESYGHTPRYFKSSSDNIRVEVDKVCFEGQDCYKYGYADCSGKQILITTSNANNQTSQANTTTTTTTTTQQNDLTEYNRSKADLERQMAERNQAAVNKNAEAQKQQQLLKQQQEQLRQQQLQQNVNQVATATADLITQLASRRRASKSSLSYEDAQVLLGIVNSETPLDYTQTIIDIFSDLGYTFKSSETLSYGGQFISMYDNSTIQWPLSIIIDPATRNNPYSRLKFDYQRKDVLRGQLARLGDKLEDFTVKGITADRLKMKIEEDKLKLDTKSKRALEQIEIFEKKKYWNSTDRRLFDYAKEIAEAFENPESLNNKDEAIRYYKKAATISLDDLASPWPLDKSMRKYQEEQLAKVYFRIGFLTDDADGKGAIDWYNKSVTLYPASANKNIGLIYKNGTGGVDKDWKSAAEYFEKAANNENAASMCLLGELYRKGGPNLQKNESKAKKWAKKACKLDKKYCD